MGRPTRSACQPKSTLRPRTNRGVWDAHTVESERVSTSSRVISAREELDEQVVRLLVGEVSGALRDVCELDASELDPEKNEGVTFLWKRVKFMEGNPRRVLDFWAGVEGVELEWIMRSTRGEGRKRGRGLGRSLLDPYISQ